MQEDGRERECVYVCEEHEKPLLRTGNVRFKHNQLGLLALLDPLVLPLDVVLQHARFVLEDPFRVGGEELL